MRYTRFVQGRTRDLQHRSGEGIDLNGLNPEYVVGRIESSGLLPWEREAVYESLMKKAGPALKRYIQETIGLAAVAS